jgi:hypothetical protein
MNNQLNWASLVRQGRVKAHGIPWTKEEKKALKNGMTADEVRAGYLTEEQKEENKDDDDVSTKSLKELKEEADELGIEYTDSVNRGDLAIEVHKERKKIEDRPLEDMKRHELMSLFSDIGGKVDFSMKKDELIKKIKKLKEK